DRGTGDRSILVAGADGRVLLPDDGSSGGSAARRLGRDPWRPGVHAAVARLPRPLRGAASAGYAGIRLERAGYGVPTGGSRAAAPALRAVERRRPRLRQGHAAPDVRGGWPAAHQAADARRA